MKASKTRRPSIAKQGDHDLIAAHRAWDCGQKRKAFRMFLKSACKGNADSYNTVGVMYSDGDGVKKSYQWGLFWLNKAIQAKPDEFMAYNNIGCIKRDQGDFEAAELWYKKAIQLGDSDAWLNLAKVYLGPFQDITKAREALHRVMEYTPYQDISEYSQEEAIRLLRNLDQ